MKIAFFMYQGMTALNLIGPYEILSRLPEVQVLRVGQEKGSVITDTGLQLFADYSFSDVAKAEILIIPGAGRATSFEVNDDVLNWIRKIHKEALWLASVCTGSLILGATGLLVGKKATSHWAAIHRLKKWGAEPVHERVVIDGEFITSAGVSAGIDMALVLTGKLFGEEVAQAIQLGIEYDPDPPFNAGSPSKAPIRIVERLRDKMSKEFDAV